MRLALAVCVLLAGCATVEPMLDTQPTHELVGFDWCTADQLRQCGLIRQEGELLEMRHPSRIGGTADVWDTISQPATQIGE